MSASIASPAASACAGAAPIIVARVLLPAVADLMPLMPVKVPPDLSKFLLCPMPGQIVRIDVTEGESSRPARPSPSSKP